jgi:capsular polysaccharide biosynthesis protein
MAQREMEKTDQAGLRADGKIWVVMAVCLTILAGILFYLYSLDKKIKRLEQKENS